jgi:hypothetical protein
VAADGETGEALVAVHLHCGGFKTGPPPPHVPKDMPTIVRGTPHRPSTWVQHPVLHQSHRQRHQTPTFIRASKRERPREQRVALPGPNSTEGRRSDDVLRPLKRYELYPFQEPKEVWTSRGEPRVKLPSSPLEERPGILPCTERPYGQRRGLRRGFRPLIHERSRTTPTAED